MEEDGSSYVRARARLDSSIRKNPVSLKTFDYNFGGIPNSTDSPCTMVRPFSSGGLTGFGGSVSWCRFLPNIGTGVDELHGSYDCVVDGIKVSVSSWLRYSMFVDNPNYDMQPRQRVFLELLYVPVPPTDEQDVDQSQLGLDYFTDVLYEFSLTKDQVWNAFLRKSAIRSGVKSLKRWTFTLRS